MAREDEEIDAKIIRMIGEAIGEAISKAIGTADVQDSLHLAASDDSESYNAVAESLRNGARSILKTQFTNSNSHEAARYDAAIREALDQLRKYVNTFPDYQTLWSIEEEVIRQARQEMELREELGTQRALARAREAAAEMQHPSRSPFWKINRRTESGELGRKIASLGEEMTQHRRKVADIATERRRFELRVWPTEPNYGKQSKIVADARKALCTAVLEASLPNLRASIHEYAELTHLDKGSLPAEADPPGDSGSTLSDGDPDNGEGEHDLTSQLEEASPAKSVGVTGPGDKRSVFLVHGRDIRAAIEMRSFLRALGLRVIEWETAVLETGHAAPYIGDVIFAGMRTADAVVILSTPDDLVRLRPDLLSNDDSVHEREIRGQARANVIYEAGIADALDRSRTVLVELGGVKSLGPKWPKRSEIRRRLQVAA